MSDSIRFIVYADIHHASSAASRGLVLDDTIKIERDLLVRAHEGNFDFTLFAGDRFLKREPEDEVKVRADRLFYELYPNYKPHYHLIGNHDWTDNTRKWHTAESMKFLPNVYVMDCAQTYEYSDKVLIHALPADFDFDMSKYAIDPEKLNLFVFHDTVIGSYLSEDFDKTIGSGIEVGEIDRQEFDLVFAGDIHVPQTFKLRNTIGGYVGSILQRTRGDSNRERGWVEVEATRVDGKWEFKTDFVPTRNFFTRVSFKCGPKTCFEDLRIPEEMITNQVVEVRLIGNKENVDRVAAEPRWANYEELYLARKLDIMKAYEIEQSDVVVDMSSSNSMLDDLGFYIKSGFVNLGNLQAEKLVDLVRQLNRD
jgi:hypothetical protein